MAEKNFTLKRLSELTNSKLFGNENLVISGVNSLEDATPLDASFLANIRYTDAMKKSKAGVICIEKNFPPEKNKNFLVSENPSKTFQMIIELFISSENDSGFKGIHKTAIIHDSSKLDKDVTIMPYVVIDKNVHIEKGTTIYPNCYIGPNVKIGKFCKIYPNVVIRENVKIADFCIIQPGAIIGSCGFGYIPDEKGNFQKLKQIGSVSIEENVEIGANTTIDRARFQETKIKKGAKIDNLVQIAHNVEIGENNAIAAQSGFSGSSKTGKNVIIAGQVGVAGHLELSDNTMIAAQSGISKNLPPGKYRGTPAIPINKWNREKVHIRNLLKHVKKLKDLENKVSKLEKASS